MLGFELNQTMSEGSVMVIKIPEEKREEVLVILLKNGSFRSLSKNTFEIEENAAETITKIKDQGIKVEIV